jgi:hypothetical protein
VKNEGERNGNELRYDGEIKGIGKQEGRKEIKKG